MISARNEITVENAMKRYITAMVALACCVLVPVAFAQCGGSYGKGPSGKGHQVVELKNAKGESVGKATLAKKGDGVAIKLDVRNLPPGEHAVHVHQMAKCEADPNAPQDAFKSAGPHFNPGAKKHGLENPEGPHAGDMPNFTVGQDGTAKTTVANPRVTLDESASNSVYAGGGTALVIHAKADDMKTDPAGNAGDRIACGLIAK
jgi:Cu-Zn family superoxide dismutase